MLAAVCRALPLSRATPLCAAGEGPIITGGRVRQLLLGRGEARRAWAPLGPLRGRRRGARERPGAGVRVGDEIPCATGLSALATRGTLREDEDRMMILTRLGFRVPGKARVLSWMTKTLGRAALSTSEWKCSPLAPAGSSGGMFIEALPTARQSASASERERGRGRGRGRAAPGR